MDTFKRTRQYFDKTVFMVAFSKTIRDDAVRESAPENRIDILSKNPVGSRPCASKTNDAKNGGGRRENTENSIRTVERRDALGCWRTRKNSEMLRESIESPGAKGFRESAENTEGGAIEDLTNTKARQCRTTVVTAKTLEEMWCQ